jgi:hypothetical protein
MQLLVAHLLLETTVWICNPVLTNGLMDRGVCNFAGVHVQLRYRARTQVQQRRDLRTGRAHAVVRRQESGRVWTQVSCASVPLFWPGFDDFCEISRGLTWFWIDSQGPGEDSVEQAPGGLRGGVHGELHGQGESRGAFEGRGEEGGDHGLQQGRAHVRGGREREGLPAGAHRGGHGELHHQLHGAAPARPARAVRRRGGAPHHRALPHRHQLQGLVRSPGGALAQGLARRRAQPHPQLHDGVQGHRPPHPVAQGQDPQRGVPRPHARRLPRGPHRPPRPTRLLRRRLRCGARGGRGGHEGRARLQRRRPRRGHRRQPVLHRRRQSRVRPGGQSRQARGVVRQRVGLQVYGPVHQSHTTSQ